ncbi:MAG: nuclear transport factor 2 family protein [Methanoregula sp.]|uniref:nuclear transport factor 2 family protein n=1 Tax=Methanoregula sp. TaxID=2052170 RepID=UPI003D137591
MKDQPETNKTTVRDFYNLALNLKKPEEAVAKFMGPYYRQHNPGAGDGAEAFIAFVREFVKAFPTLHFNFKRIVAQGDLVVVHSHLVRHAGDRGMAVMDIFRLENGKVVEHWDVLQEVPETPANDNTMF